MTKEQAIAILRYNSNVIHQTINGETDPNEVEALDMAIKALEHDGPDMNVGRIDSEDCVSRQAMLNAITEIDENINMDIYTNEVREIIEALPPVTPTFPKGTTNGDMLKAMFPNIEFKKDHEFTVWGYINDGDCIVRYDIDWWNAPYKRGNEND